MSSSHLKYLSAYPAHVLSQVERLVADGRLADHLLRRYPEYKVMPPPDPAAIKLLRVTPKVVSILDYSKGFGHSDLVRVTDADLAEYIESRRHHWAGHVAA